jgi:hypothetical protein
MQRALPSKQIGQKTASLLSHGVKGDINLVAELMKEGVQVIFREALEQDVPGHLKRGRYERQAQQPARRGYRNGWEPKHSKASGGKVASKLPGPRGKNLPLERSIHLTRTPF